METAKTVKTTQSINRIVIGDVGSGKTVTAFLIALNYLRSLGKGQVVLLAPTEVLAFQHYQKLLELIQKDTWLNNTVDSIYCSGRLSQHNGKKITNKQLVVIANKTQITFFVGTHALLFKDFIKPDMVMVDEQHRFGVQQRQLLTNKTDYQPHFISFSATPIPRTLALTVYKSLKPHFLETLENRNNITTLLFSFDRFPEIIKSISNQVNTGKKVYVVCAKVEEVEEDLGNIWSIKKATELMELYFPDKVLHVHGKKLDKKEILQEFKESVTKQILVATTVIEVGVDVSEATMIIVLNAERFGLSALHQIRGRVGRNSYPENFCYLVTEKHFLRSKRLEYIRMLTNGFEIAEKDLELRGAGDLIGKNQSGFSDEIQNLIGLNPEAYNSLDNLVGNIPLKNLADNLPRLSRYIKIQTEKIWEE